jgi:hypothetical protein
MSELKNKIKEVSETFKNKYGEYYQNLFDIVISDIQNDTDATKIIIDIFYMTMNILKSDSS